MTTTSTHPAGRASMLREAKASLAAAEEVLEKRRTNAGTVVTRSLDALARVQQRWDNGDATHLEVRNAVIRAHNDIMRAPSPFSLDQAARRVTSARSVVDQLEGGTDDA